LESQLRAAYAKRHEQGRENQSTIAKKLGVDKSVISRRLSGRSNMTLETVADMVWALGHCIDVTIFDPEEIQTNSHFIAPQKELGSPWSDTFGGLQSASAFAVQTSVFGRRTMPEAGATRQGTVRVKNFRPLESEQEVAQA